MGEFSLPPPPPSNSPPSVSYINMISSSMILIDPWVVPCETDIQIFGDRMLLSLIEQYYEAIYSACASHTFSLINFVDWSLNYGTPSDPLSYIFSTNQGIMEIIMLDDTSWDEHHDRSSLTDSIEDNISGLYMPNFFEPSMNFISIHEINFEKNLSNIEEKYPLNISVILGIVENIHIGASCSSF